MQVRSSFSAFDTLAAPGPARRVGATGREGTNRVGSRAARESASGRGPYHGLQSIEGKGRVSQARGDDALGGADWSSIRP